MHDFPSSGAWLAHRVSYGETDAMGIVYYAEYFHFFERARNTYIRSHGMSYTEVEARGILLPVREAQCRYRTPVRFDETIWVHAAISSWGRASLKFVYEIFSEDKKTLLATGMTQHAVVNREGRPVALPEWLRALRADSVLVPGTA